MNKRQKKKRNKIEMERVRYFNKHHLELLTGKINGKSYNFNMMLELIFNKKHKPFEDIKKGKR